MGANGRGATSWRFSGRDTFGIYALFMKLGDDNSGFFMPLGASS